MYCRVTFTVPVQHHHSIHALQTLRVVQLGSFLFLRNTRPSLQSIDPVSGKIVSVRAIRHEKKYSEAAFHKQGRAVPCVME